MHAEASMRACRCVERVLRAVATGSAELMVASHNQASVTAAAAAMRSLGLDAEKSGDPSSMPQRAMCPPSFSSYFWSGSANVAWAHQMGASLAHVSGASALPAVVPLLRVPSTCTGNVLWLRCSKLASFPGVCIEGAQACTLGNGWALSRADMSAGPALPFPLGMCVDWAAASRNGGRREHRARV